MTNGDLVTRLAYHSAAAALFLCGLAGAAVAWIRADRLYGAGDQVMGWRIGMAGLALPVLCLGACALWLRWLRGRGHPDADVAWLKWALLTSAAIWGGLFLFSLM